MVNYGQLNREVMLDTKKHYESDAALQEAVRQSIELQYMVAQEENIDQPHADARGNKYLVSGKRSFEAAKQYAERGMKVAVLNFANNHSIGGAPFAAGAQEESLCRCSTLLPCLVAMKEGFYDRHRRQFSRKEIGNMGNDDLIYTPGVVVFKTDERNFVILPRLMERDEWYKVDVITCAAPEMNRVRHWPDNYEAVIASRIKKILDVAARERVEALILGAWGCGAFRNDSSVVARVFAQQLQNYSFPIVEFALACKEPVSSSSPFVRELLNVITCEAGVDKNN